MIEAIVRGLADELVRLIVAVAVIVASLVIAGTYGVPWLWSLVKPWLHAVTA